MTDLSSKSVQQLTLCAPDDWHVHLRDGEQLSYTVKDCAAQFRRAIVMPNLKPPITTTAQAKAYRERILKALADSAGVAAAQRFEPLMTLYLTHNTSPEEIRAAHSSAYVYGVKLYPAGATTHADAGVSDIKQCYATLAEMEKLGLPLLIHGEVTDPSIDLFDREAVFIEKHLIPLRRDFPGLRLVLEHISTADAASYVKSAEPGIAATITAHHLLYNRNAIFKGGLQPHWYCLPILKRETHRQALLNAATSGNPRFFLGTDSAPHAQAQKETACGCAGCYTAWHAIELYATAFESYGALQQLEGFASFYGPDFYGLARNTEKITLIKQALTIPNELNFGSQRLIPLAAGETLFWQRQH